MNNKNSIIIYEAKDGKVELRADINEDTIWASEIQIADIFETTQQNVNLHIKNIYNDDELRIDSTHKDFLYVRKEGNRNVKRLTSLYNLDMIIAIGYRVSSKKATQFRIWATGVLREYLKNGYALQHYKLKKNPESIEEIQETLSLITSKKYSGKVKGKLTLKISKNINMGE
jgi:hypothetical protein